MSTIAVLPSTLDGIKRLARTIKREQNISHHEALDVAARRARFDNFRHAQVQLHAQVSAGGATHRIFLSAFWMQKGVRGRETLTIQLPAPLGRIMTASQVGHARALMRFRMEAADHLEARVDLETQEEARLKLFDAARTVEFMAATGLVPATTMKQRDTMDRASRAPGHDHGSDWIHVESGSWVHLDEPYATDLLPERRAWATEQGLTVMQPRWGGLYVPGFSTPYLCSPDATLLERLSQQVIHLRLGAGDPRWDGQSAPYSSLFNSPARAASGVKRRPRPMPAYHGAVRNGAVPYGARRGGEESMWRPAVRMPLQTHLQLGPIMAALHDGLDGVARRKVSAIRSRLDDWLQMEYPSEDEMSSEQFHNAYYGATRVAIDEPGQQVKAIDRALELLYTGYADCPPRREMIGKLDRIRAKLA
jgi:hypothetical protein